MRARSHRADPVDPDMTRLPCACANARRVARVLTQLYDSRLRPAGLEAPQFALLTVLDQQGPCSQAALGRRHALDKTTVSRNLELLQRKRWIAPAPAGDRRERRFTLTAEGRRRIAAARPAWKKTQDDLRSRMPAGEWEAMFLAFQTVSAAAQQAHGDSVQRARIL